MSLTEEDKQWIVTQLSTQLSTNRAEIIGATDAKLEALETKLLRAFHDWASPVEMRVRSHTAVLRAMDLDIEALGNRLSKLEPPQ